MRQYVYSPSFMKELCEDDKYHNIEVLCKGHLDLAVVFNLLEDGYTIQYRVCDKTDFPHRKHKFQKYSIIPGLEFLDAVKSGYFIDYDGTIADIIIDGYISELGLTCEGITQGNFLVDYDVFKEICESHEVYVNWANK